MEVGPPATSEEHLPLEHDPVDPAAAMEFGVGVVLLGVGHGAEEDGDTALAGAIHRHLQVADHVVHPHGLLREVPRRSALREEVVDGVDDEEGRLPLREGSLVGPSGQVRGAALAVAPRPVTGRRIGVGLSHCSASSLRL